MAVNSDISSESAAGLKRLPFALFEDDPRCLIPQEAQALIELLGEPAYRARQLLEWLYRHRVDSVAAMVNLPVALRIKLDQYLKSRPLDVIDIAASTDGTRKLLLRLSDAELVESVIIPGVQRTTLCLSTQVGCAMDCAFCATARMGLRRNLGAGEIVGQVIVAGRHLLPDQSLTNYVFMGMGEPLANYPRLLRALTVMTSPWGLNISPRRITVSTVGLVPAIERLMADTQVHLAVSLHATTDDLRDRLAPINRRYPLQQLLDACRRLDLGRRRITFEYVMLRGVNDSPADAARLVHLLAPLRAKVNLIFFNSFAGAPFQGSERRSVEAFKAILLQGNLTATIRESRGRDVAAACGQLWADRGSNASAAEPIG